MKFIVVVTPPSIYRISLVDIIGHTWEEYLFSVLVYGFVKCGTNAYYPIGLIQIFYRYVVLHIIN